MPTSHDRSFDKILEKCDGLPLATIAISGLLSTKAPTEDQWNQVEQSIGYALERNRDIDAMIRTLSLSYFDLPNNLRTCLLYLSTFPEDYTIHKKRLIRRWIAEGFIHGEHGHTLYELGRRCFNELINRSLIQPEDVGKFGAVKTCRVHDTILDFIISKSAEENFVTLLGVPNVTIDLQDKVRQLSCFLDEEEGDGSKDINILKKLNLCNARSITLFGLSMIPSLSEFRNLRVLDFEDCWCLEDHHLANIGKLLHLKYLSLKGTCINVLPRQITRLQYLETLNVDVLDTINIPTHMFQLGRLIHLLVELRSKLPDEIGNMQALQELKVMHVFVQSLNSLRGLGKLTNLRKLSIYIPSRYGNTDDDHAACKDHMEAMISSICTLGRANLHCLTISSISGPVDDFLQESWSPPPLSLRELVMKKNPMPRVPRWIGSLVNLQRLGLSMKKVGQHDIGTLGGLPTLCFFIIYVREGRLTEEEGGWLRISGSHGFPSLECIQIGGWNCELGLIFETGCVPKLQQLNLEYRVGTSSDVVFGIEHLPCLTSIYCSIQNFSINALAAMERTINGHPNHPTFAYEY